MNIVIRGTKKWKNKIELVYRDNAKNKKATEKNSTFNLTLLIGEYIVQRGKNIQLKRSDV